MAQFDHGYALLIGVSENKVPGWSIPAVTNDLAALEQALADPQRCAYLPEHIKTISGTNATRQGILDGLDWLHDQLAADTSGSPTAIILYSGLAWHDAEPASYLIPYDVRQDNLRSRALRVEDFAGAIDTLPGCRLLILLDGGQAAEMGSQPGIFSAAALPPGLLMAGERAIGARDGEAGWQALPQGQGRAVLSASQGEQPSYARGDGKMSLFIYYLTEALSGKARPAGAAQTAGNEVLLMDVVSHVWGSVPGNARESWGKDQQPDFQASGNFPLGLLLGGRGLPASQPAPGQMGTPSPTGQGVSYAVSTGGGDFTGRDKIVQGDQIHGDKITGDKVGRDKIAGDSIRVGDISGNSNAIAIGRNAHASVTGISSADLERAFAPMMQALHEVPPETQAEATQVVHELKEEAAKGSKANDSRLAGLLDELVGMVPGMVTVIASTFGTPLLGGIAGPVTNFVLDKIRGGR